MLHWNLSIFFFSSILDPVTPVLSGAKTCLVWLWARLGWSPPRPRQPGLMLTHRKHQPGRANLWETSARPHYAEDPRARLQQSLRMCHTIIVAFFEALRPRRCKSAEKWGSKAPPPTNKYTIICTNPSRNKHYYFFLLSPQTLQQALKSLNESVVGISLSRWYFQWAVLKI